MKVTFHFRKKEVDSQIVSAILLQASKSELRTSISKPLLICFPIDTAIHNANNVTLQFSIKNEIGN